MTEQLTIRPIEPRDDAALYVLIRHALEINGLGIDGTAYTDPQLAWLSRYYADDPRRGYFVVEDSSGVITAGAGFGEYDETAGIAELQKLYSDSRFAGQGVSYRLIAVIEEAAKQAGYRQLYLESRHELQAALHVYEKAGFTRLDAPPKDPSHAVMDYYFIKDLG